jgi:hypothetical protein
MIIKEDKIMSIFSELLQKVAGDLVTNPVIQNKTLIGTIDADLRAKITIDDRSCRDNYDTIRISIINRVEGKVDTHDIPFETLWGIKKIRPGFTVSPHIWVYKTEEWYAWEPDNSDLKVLHDAIKSYIDVFRKE